MAICYVSEVTERLPEKRLGGGPRSSRAMAVLGLVVVGCGSPAGAPPASTSSLPSVACNGKAKPGDSVLTIESGGIQRTVLLHLPTGYTDLQKTPLVLNLHGSESTASQQEALTGMNATADQDGFIVAYPQGAIAAGAGYEWNIPGQPLLGGSSVPANAASSASITPRMRGESVRSSGNCSAMASIATPASSCRNRSSCPPRL